MRYPLPLSFLPSKAITLLLAVAIVTALLASPTLAAPPNYEDDIKPLFRDHCLKCHNADDADADLDLSTIEATLRGGSSGKVVAAGRPDSSQLLRAVAHLEGAEPMPPESDKLPDAKINLIRQWIQGGLVAGQGQQSQLRAVAMVAATDVAESPLPVGLDKLVAKTIRPPIPQAIAASPGAPLLAVAGHEQVLLYQVTAGTALKLLGSLPFPAGSIHTLRFSRSGTLLLAGGGRGGHSGRVVIFDVASGKAIGALGEEVDVVLAADLSADHQYVALGGPSKAVAIYDTATGEQIHRIKKHTDWITALQFSPDGKLLATGDRSGGIHVWEVERGAIVYTLAEHKVQINGLSWRGDGKILVSAAEDGNMILWDMTDGWPAKNITAHQRPSSSRYTRSTGITGVDFAADGKLVTVGRDHLLRIWTAEGEQLAQRPIESGLPIAVTFLGGCEQIVSGQFDGTLRLWSIKDSQPVATQITGQ
jgi:mono/diheme cytochrome c family protein